MYHVDYYIAYFMYCCSSCLTDSYYFVCRRSVHRRAGPAPAHAHRQAHRRRFIIIIIIIIIIRSSSNILLRISLRDTYDMCISKVLYYKLPQYILYYNIQTYNMPYYSPARPFCSVHWRARPTPAHLHRQAHRPHPQKSYLINLVDIDKFDNFDEYLVN